MGYLIAAQHEECLDFHTLTAAKGAAGKRTLKAIYAEQDIAQVSSFLPHTTTRVKQEPESEHLVATLSYGEFGQLPAEQSHPYQAIRLTLCKLGKPATRPQSTSPFQIDFRVEMLVLTGVILTQHLGTFENEWSSQVYTK